MPNINDVARLARVSAMTVSRVINGSEHVKEETRQRVLQAMKELNYVPNGLARSLVRKRTQTLALIVPDITNTFFTSVARGTENTAHKYKYRVVLCNSDEDVMKESQYIDMCLSIRVDGIVIAPTGDESRKNLQLLESHGVPYVLLDREVQNIQADAVIGDSILGSKKLVEHLLALGHREIAVITGRTTTSTARDRVQGYKEALKEHGIQFHPKYVKEASFKRTLDSKLVHVIDELLACSPTPTAIFAGNNMVAMQAVHILQDRGLSIPKDMSITCFDDFDPLAMVEQFLTVARQPAYNFGSLATQLLIERIDRIPIPAPRRIILRPEIVIGRSTGIPNAGSQ